MRLLRLLLSAVVVGIWAAVLLKKGPRQGKGLLSLAAAASVALLLYAVVFYFTTPYPVATWIANLRFAVDRQPSHLKTQDFSTLGTPFCQFNFTEAQTRATQIPRHHIRVNARTAEVLVPEADPPKNWTPHPTPSPASTPSPILPVECF